ncbi:MAG: NADH-quinone oxidoreductase subunit L, partial [Proteobacteria bacterium]|nr:NADH-quinone oxidoreductase subunit L [Pseudomonadota bacterium]
MHEHTWEFIWLIPLFPMVGALINGLLGKRLPKSLVHWIACGSVFLSFAVSVWGFATLRALPASERVLTQTLFEWIAAGTVKIDLAY